MRRVLRSRTAVASFDALLLQGLPKFGIAVVMEKARLVDDAIDHYLAEFPHLGLRTRGQPFLHYPVRHTPFVVIYEYDDKELRILFVVHESADRRDLDSSDVRW